MLLPGQETKEHKSYLILSGIPAMQTKWLLEKMYLTAGDVFTVIMSHVITVIYIKTMATAFFIDYFYRYQSLTFCNIVPSSPRNTKCPIRWHGHCVNAIGILINKYRFGCLELFF